MGPDEAKERDAPSTALQDDLSPRAMLTQAAYFVDSAMCYPGLEPMESIVRYQLFLPAPLLREVVGNPFRSACA